MKILVQKFGGTSVATDEARQQAAQKVIRAVQHGWSVVVVVSAIGRVGAPYATDTLLKVLSDVDPSLPPAKREQDLMMACGEIISTVVLAHTLRARGLETVALTGWQAGIVTDYEYGSARILSINPRYIIDKLSIGTVVLVAGFQGATERGAITTLGRGGSDTTGAALGAALKPFADEVEVEIYTDVSGVKTADPRYVADTKTLEKATYQEVAEMAHQGAKVVHPRAAEIAGLYDVPLWVKSTFNDEPGTLITATPPPRAGARFTGVTHTGRLVYLRFPIPAARASDRLKIELEVYRILQRENIAANLTSDAESEFAFAVGREHLPRLREVIDGLLLPIDLGGKPRLYLLGIGTEGKAFEAQRQLVDAARRYVEVHTIQAEVVSNCTLVSVIASGLEDIPGVVAKTLATLDSAKIPVFQTADSTYSISALIPEPDAQKATQVLHSAFLLGGSA